MPDSARVLDLLDGQLVVPVVEIDDPRAAVPLTRALAAGGVRVVEITFRTEHAAAAIAAATAETASVVAAGTLLSPVDVEQAVAAGAAFGVSPGWDPATFAAADELGLPVVPGVGGASDLQQRLAEGHRLVKFFPAEASGGVAALRHISAAMGHTGVRFMPTGGVDAANAADYLALEAVVAVGGSWPAPRSLIREGAWDRITDLATQAAALSGARGSG